MVSGVLVDKVASEVLSDVAGLLLTGSDGSDMSALFSSISASSAVLGQSPEVKPDIPFSISSDLLHICLLLTCCVERQHGFMSGPNPKEKQQPLPESDDSAPGAAASGACVRFVRLWADVFSVFVAAIGA